MSGFKGTKGPWYPVEYAGRFVIQTEDRYSDSDDIFESDDFSYEEVKANVQLASKAPEMLEMLEIIYQQVDFSFEAFGSDTGIKMEDQIKKLIKSCTEL